MRKQTRFPVLFAISTPVLFVFWMVFVGTFSKWELLVGIGAAIVGGVAVWVVERADNSHFSPRISHLLQSVFLPWALLQDTYIILIVSLRDLLGGRKAVSAFRIVKFEAGDSRDPHDTARRVLAQGLSTMTPNFIALGINTNQKQLLFHQIERTAVPKLAKNLGAEV